MCQQYREVQDLINKHDQEKVTIILPKMNGKIFLSVIFKVELLNFE